MMSYDEYKTGCHNLTAMTKKWFTNSKNNYKNEKEKTKKKHKEKINVILTVWFTQNNQWIGVNLAAQIVLINSPSTNNQNDDCNSNDNEKERWVYD